MSSGGRVFPSVTGGGLTSAAQAILDAQLSARERALRSRQLDIQEEGQTRQLDIADRAQAIEQLTTLSRFVPAGTKLSDLGAAGEDLIRRGFQMDPSGLGDLELNPETFLTALDSKRLEFLETPEFAALLSPSTRVALGLPASEIEQDANEVQAEFTVNNLRGIIDNPIFAREAIERTLGRDPVHLRIPGVEGEISFDSTTAANIYAQFLLAREEFGFRLDLEREDPIKALIEEVQAAVRGTDQEISPLAVQRVMGVYNDAVENQDISLVTEYLNDPNVAPGEKTALRFLAGSIGIGENALLENYPPQLRNFVLFRNFLRDSELTPEQNQRILEQATSLLDPQFSGRFVDPFGSFDMFGQGPRLEFGAGPAAAEENPTTLVAGEATDEEIRAAFEAGDTMEQLITALGRERVERAIPPIPIEETRLATLPPEGGINPDSVPAPFRADARQLNNMLRALERTRGEVARRNLQNAIDRLRDRIERGSRSLR